MIYDEILCKEFYDKNMTYKKLENLRNQINDLDNKILEILDIRSNVVSKIGKLKDLTKGVIDENREQAVLDRLLKLSKGKYSKDTIVRIWRELFDASTRIQLKSKSKITTKRSIEKIQIYKGGKSSIDGVKNIIKLSSNENILGPSKKIKSNLSVNLLHKYPEINGQTLRNKIAKIHNIKSDQIVLGCGSDETLLFAALAFCQTGDEIIHAEHGFEMYSIIAKVVGAVSKLAKEENYKVSVNSIYNEITSSTKLIYIANPNNPTGSYLTKKEIIELMLKIPKNVIVVLDGAYAEYVEKNNYDSGFSLVKKFDNIVLTRTFSKAYGLAGLRLGWCYSSKKVSNILQKVKGPFNINTVAQEMAIVALSDQDHLKYIIKHNKEVKKWFEDQLIKLKIKTHLSFANFSFIELTDKKAKMYAKHLEKNGIVIRQLHSYNLSHCLRITIGTKNNMKKVIKILSQLV